MGFMEAMRKMEDQSCNQKTVHVLNGQAMLQMVKENQLLLDDTVIAFNEAMCTHQTNFPIFTENFNRLRAKGHDVTLESYHSVVLQALQPLFDTTFDQIVLWFGKDVFCQMNVLTLLAYFEQAGVKTAIYLATFDEIMDDGVTLQQMRLGTFRELYDTVLIEKRQPNPTENVIFDQAITRFLALEQLDNPIALWIKQNQELTEEALVRALIQQFPEYGYGDVQYQALIQNTKNNAKDK